MKKILLVASILNLILLLPFTSTAKTIHITKGHSDPIAIAINDFALSNNYDLILYENSAFVSAKIDITQQIINIIEHNSP